MVINVSVHLVVLFLFLFWCPYMVINVSVQYNNGGFLLENILLILCDYIGEPFECHEEVLTLQLIFPPTNPFDCSGDLVALIFSFKQREFRCRFSSRHFPAEKVTKIVPVLCW